MPRDISEIESRMGEVDGEDIQDIQGIPDRIDPIYEITINVSIVNSPDDIEMVTFAHRHHNPLMRVLDVLDLVEIELIRELDGFISLGNYTVDTMMMIPNFDRILRDDDNVHNLANMFNVVLSVVLS